MLQHAAKNLVTRQPTPLNATSELWTQLASGIQHTLKTAANVHRGSGHASVAMTHLYEKARQVVVKHFGLPPKKYLVVFCPVDRTARFTANLPSDSVHILSANTLGLTIGVDALAVRRSALPKGAPLESGGGTTRLIGNDWVIWADAPDRFEPGTPAYINVIAFALALSLTQPGKPNRFIEDAPADTAEIMHSDALRNQSGEQLLTTLLATRIGKDMHVPTTRGRRRYIHLDHSASTPTFEPIFNVFMQTLRQPPDKQHQLTTECRKILSRVFDAPQADYRTYFTSGTTEAVYAAAQHLKGTLPSDVAPVVVSTHLEHSSNDLPWRDIAGCHVIHLNVDDDGFFDITQLRTLLNEYNVEKLHGNRRIVLVTIAGASNVLGTCNDIAPVSKLVHQHHARLFVDGAQLVAHRSVSMKILNIDYLAFSGHKVYAPFGAGALIVRKNTEVNLNALPQLTRWSESTNAAGIAAMGKALSLLERIGFEFISQREHDVTQYALSSLSTIPGLRIYGISDPKSPRLKDKVGVIPFDIKNTMPAKTAKELMLRGGIGVRYGCHCAHMIVKQILHIGPRLQIFQRILQTVIPPIKFQGVVRISFGLETTREDIDAVVDVLRDAVKKKKPHAKDTASMKEAKQQVAVFVKERQQKVFGV